MSRNEQLKAAYNDNAVRMQDDTLTLLAQSYRWHKANNIGLAMMQRDRSRTGMGEQNAVGAIAFARLDVAANKRRYPHDSCAAVVWFESDNPRSSERLA
ncbi:hypothetical protein G3A39_42330, partial [Paraburkholderia aspalathi]|nr:hypothetical protein [Paraburkholderia aspalathi]